MQAVDALQQIVDRTAVTVILQVRIRGVAQCRQFIHVGLQLVAGGCPCSLQALHQRHDDRRVIAAIGTNRVEDKRQPSLRAQLWIEQPGLAIVDAAHVQRRDATQATEQHAVQIEHAYCRARSLIDGLMAFTAISVICRMP